MQDMTTQQNNISKITRQNIIVHNKIKTPKKVGIQSK